jgi:CheY-like chemotaxis protein
MIEIRSSAARDLPNVQADPTQVHQIVMNLGTNAAYAMAETGGVLDVRLEVVTVSEELARTSADLTAGRYLRLAVADSGHGIEDGILSRIFEPFFTTKPAGLGSGLGLSVVHGIMKSHGGAVTVYSEPMRGTKFHLYFPATEQDVAVGAAERNTLPPGGGKHVLVLDDEEPLAFLTARILKRIGYRVTTHTEPTSALQDFRSRPREFDAIITDHSMPTMSGVEFVRRVRELRPEIAVVIASGYFRPEDTAAAHAVGVQELVSKPGTIDDLGEALHRALLAQASDVG